MILNYTPHTIILAHINRELGEEFRLALPPVGLARVDAPQGSMIEVFDFLSSGKLQPFDDEVVEDIGEPESFPFPVYEKMELGGIEGLPETVDPATMILVSAVVGGSAELEAAALEALIRRPSQEITADQFKASARLAVLRALVVPGTGPKDDAIRDGEGRVMAIKCVKRAVARTIDERRIVWTDHGSGHSVDLGPVSDFHLLNDAWKRGIGWGGNAQDGSIHILEHRA